MKNNQAASTIGVALTEEQRSATGIVAWRYKLRDKEGITPDTWSVTSDSRLIERMGIEWEVEALSHAILQPDKAAPYGWQSIYGKQHDTGRVVTAKGNFFATTGSPENAKLIADALNARSAPATPQHHDEGAGEVIAYMARDNRLSRPPGPDCTSPNDGWSDWHPTTKKHGESILENKRNFPENYWNWQVRPLAYADAATPQHSVTDQASIDTPEFDDLLCKFAHESSCEQYDEVEYTKARTALLSYISQPLASTAATQPEQVEGPRAWMIWLHGPAGVFENKDEALLELARRNRLYPKEASDRKLLELSAALAIPASTAKAGLRQCKACGKMFIDDKPGITCSRCTAASEQQAGTSE